MAGSYSGLQARIKNYFDYFVHCAAHIIGTHAVVVDS